MNKSRGEVLVQGPTQQTHRPRASLQEDLRLGKLQPTFLRQPQPLPMYPLSLKTALSHPELAPQLYTRELEYLCRVEWAHSAEDILWRRSKLGLHLAPAATTAVQAWLDARATAEPSAHSRSPP